MACCVDKPQNEADACCGSGETRQGSDPFGVPTTALPVLAPVAFTFAAVVPIPSAVFDVVSQIAPTSDSHRHARLSVFLI